MERLISKIQHLSTQDGPGIRTTIFFKGCLMNCAWCHNPEAIDREISLGFDFNKCINCGACVNICNTKALTINNGRLIYDKSKCNRCLKCVDECFYNVITVSGKYYNEEELVKELLQDLAYYKASNGGVTFSGGEPLLEKDFIINIINRLDKYNISFCIETSLFIKLDKPVIDILSKCDFCYIDLKFYSSALHKKWTKVDNKLIIKNLKELEKYNIKIKLRTPIIEGVNDSEEELGEIAKFAKSLKNVISYTLIPYHPLGLIKYKTFNIPIRYDNKSFFDKDKLKKLQLYVDKIMGRTE